MRYDTLSYKHASRLSTPVRLGVAAVTACFLAAPVLSNPVNPTVVNGAATFNQAGSVLTVTNSNGAIINWDKFSIQAGETTHFAQTAASSTVLNRVLNDPTAIYGTLSSNGRVWLVNPAGIMVGPGGRVDTAGFVASTLGISNENFLAGRHLFINDGSAKDVINQGEIRTPAGGSVYLIGSNVSNEGIITTPGGETILAAGATVSLIDSATPGVKVDITGAEGNATNLGTITAEAGRIGIAGIIVRNSGMLNASSVVSEGGRIFLKASQDAYVDGNGRIVTTGTKGGSVEVLGNRVAVMDNAEIDVSGANGGGSIKVGGDYQGKNPDIQNASITWFGSNANLKADATEVGDGGTVIVWADDTTRAYGNISARGGANGGNGGFVETSGHSYLDFHASVDTRAPNGQAGTLLLDPADVTINNSSTYGGSFDASHIFTSSSGISTLSWADLISQLGQGNVVVTTTTTGTGGVGNITVAASPTSGYGYNVYDISITHTDSSSSWTNTQYGSGYNSPYNLSLLANNAVNINAYFGNAGSGAINIMAGWNGVSTSAPALNSSFTSGPNVNFYGGGIFTKGALTIQAVDSVRLDASAPAGYGAWIDMDTATLSITANRLLLSGSGSKQAAIRTNGDQSFTVGTYNSTYGGLFLWADQTPGVYYGGSAQIQHAYGPGGQSFTIQNGAPVELRGGAGSGYVPAGQWQGDCGVGGVCSGNNAWIGNDGSSGQSFYFVAGGSLSLYGGSYGSDNGATINNRSTTGTQSISGVSGPAILMQGGASGGLTFVYGGETMSEDNGAGIESRYTAQTINATSITMNGGTAAYGGAYLTGVGQTITVGGALNMTGGNAYGGLPTDYDVFGKTNWKSGVIIGSDVAGSSLTLNVGSLNMYGGPSNIYGGSPAVIIAYEVPANIAINSYGGISLTSGYQWGDRIGSWGETGGFGGSVSLTSTNGAISLGSGLVGTGATGITTLSAFSGISQTTTGGIGAGTLTANAGSGGISLTGTNIVSVVNESTAGAFAYNSVVPVSIYSGTAASSMAVTSALSLGFLYTGNLTLDSGYSFTAGTDLLLAASGNLTFTNAILTAPGSILLAAGGDLTMNGSLYTSTNMLGLGAAGAVNVNGSVTAYPGNIVLGAGTLNIGNAGWLGGYSGLTAVVTGDANIAGGMASGTGDLNLLVGGNLNVVGNATSYGGGYIWAGYYPLTPAFPDASIAVGGNLTLNNGAHINSANDVFIDLLGATSKLVLNDGTAGYAPSYIFSNIGTGVIGTTYLTFLSRTSGGIVIDGLETTKTVVGGSGFFAVSLSTPALEGAGLDIVYAGGSGVSIDPCILNPVLCMGTIIEPIQPPLVFDKPDEDKKAVCTEGSFGCNEDQNGKKDDKPDHKKVAQCS